MVLRIRRPRRPPLHRSQLVRSVGQRVEPRGEVKKSRFFAALTSRIHLAGKVSATSQRDVQEFVEARGFLRNWDQESCP